MTDEQKALVERLLGHSKIMERDKGKFVRFIDVATCNEAAALIEAQAAEIERLRDALMDCWLKHDEPTTVDMITRAALAQETQP